jgi:hypothetical protein
MKNFFPNKYSNTWTAEKTLFTLYPVVYISYNFFESLKKYVKFFTCLQRWAKNSFQVLTVLLHVTLIIELLEKKLEITFRLVKLRENYLN